MNASAARDIAEQGTERWLAAQLDPRAADTLPPEAQAQIDAMTISKRSTPDLLAEFFEKRQDPEFRKSTQAYGREAAARSLLRAVYSPQQLKSQMTWFWMNHFNVFQGKAFVRVVLADYEESAIQPHALGRFRDLLGAVAHHPAMLVYLDNGQNSAGHLNENYARELMELHTLGVDAGYTQKDVQELARILTGHGFMKDGYRFFPRRHDNGDKELLGTRVRGAGPRELDEALDVLARHPATARFVSRKLALYFVSDDPPPALVERMAGAWKASDGDIASVLKTLFSSPEFEASLGKKFKDPMHYAVSAIRALAPNSFDPVPVVNALFRMGEPLYGRQTPDGYPLAGSEWSSAAQMSARFEIARALGYRAPGFDFQRASLPAELGPSTRSALAQASSPQERAMLFFASPEFMLR